MYASLISAGVSTLFDLFKSQGTKSTGGASFDPSATSGSASSTTGTGTSGGLSATLGNMLLDLQSGGTDSATGTNAAQNVSHSLLAYGRSAARATGGSGGLAVTA